MAVVALAASCGGDADADAGAPGDPAAGAPATTTTTAPPSPTTEEPTTTAPDPAPPTADSGLVEVTGLRGGRYCEVLLVQPGADAITAEVYNSQGFGDCPAERWAALDPQAIAAEQAVPIARLNGPRYWLMDRIARPPRDAPPPVVDFGGIEMFRAATVTIAPEAVAAGSYVASAVDRSSVFTFDAGSRVVELLDADGRRWVMQSWSQQVDPTLVEADLAGLGDRLQLPERWSFTTRVLDEPLVVDTTGADAQVLQDELANSYSLVPPG